jgi:alpha-tubulin suppressor-like RCC1 family protein
MRFTVYTKLFRILLTLVLITISLLSFISAGSQVFAATSGIPWSWGPNGYGQLGDNTTNWKDNPAQVSGLTGVVDIAAGQLHSLAVRSDGTVWAWGYNSAGRLGDGTTTDSLIPVQVSGLSGVVNVTAGSDWSMALKSNGTVWAWGDNYYGQLGNGTTTSDNTSFPVQVRNASDTGYLTDITALAGGDWYYSLALESNGTVWAWGNNDYGQLGNGHQWENHSLPVQVRDATGTVALAGVSAISAGFGHNLALKSDGTVWAWGLDNFGQLGNNTISSEPGLLPVQVKDADGLGYLANVVAIAAGYQHNLAVKADGTVWSWGSNNYGELGDNTTTEKHLPVQVKGISGVKAVAAGANNSIALKSDGTVCIWGYNANHSWAKLTPQKVSGFSGAVDIAIKYYHSLAIGPLPPAPLAVATLAASGVTDITAVVSGNLTGKGTATVVDVSLEYGTAEGNYTDFTTPVSVNATGVFSANLTGLSANTIYYFRARATGDSTSYGNEMSFTTLITGDANNDGVINVLDISRTARIILGRNTGNSGADANHDGVVNVFDMTKIARIILGLDN